MARALIKWPGGKAGEIDQFKKLIPEYNRYIEPFMGGGALFFHLEPKKAVINDISSSLMEFYSLVKQQDQNFRDYLLAYGGSIGHLLTGCEEHYDKILSVYHLYGDNQPHTGLTGRSDATGLTGRPDATGLADRPDATGLASRHDATGLTGRSDAKCSLAEITERIACQNEYLNIIVRDMDQFRQSLIKAAEDKFIRTVRNNRKKAFSDTDLKENLITGFVSGFYMYFRDIFNDINLGRTDADRAYKAANFYFIREYCYGSMFRYNRSGEFNIPYGGMTYNRKNFLAKADYLFSRKVNAILSNTEIWNEDFEVFLNNIHPTCNDFIFLDPPYDTDFSDYEGRIFGKEDQKRLANVLKKTEANFILVIKNTDFIADLYKKDFNILAFDNQYTYNVRSRNERNVKHLIITNLALSDSQAGDYINKLPSYK